MKVKQRRKRSQQKKLKAYDLSCNLNLNQEKKRRKRSRQKKLKAYDLSSLSEYLPELKAPSESRPIESKLNCKWRNNLVLREGNQLKTVINHPIFQSDPLGAIYQHLQNTQPVVIDEQPKRKDGKTGKKRVKKKKSKASSQQSMEI